MFSRLKLFLPWPLLILPVALIGCSHPPPGRGAGELEATSQPSPLANQPQTAPVSFRVETVVANLEVPWSIVLTPDGRMFFTERPGRVRVFQNGKLTPQPVFTVPDVAPSGE